MQKRTITLLLGLLTGILISFLLLQHRNKQNVHTDDASIIPAKNIVHALQKREATYQFEKAKLLKQYHALNNTYEVITQKLAEIKEENKQLHLRVKNTVGNMYLKEDTLTYMLYCDTLQQQASALSTSCHLQGMVSDSLISNLQEQIVVKDESIALADNRIKTMDSLLYKTLQQHQALELQVKQAKKSKRKQKAWATIKTIAIAGAAIWLGQRH